MEALFKRLSHVLKWYYWKWQGRKAYRKQHRLLLAMNHINGGWSIAEQVAPDRCMKFRHWEVRMHYCINQMKKLEQNG
jgi:hypothetical protein